MDLEQTKRNLAAFFSQTVLESLAFQKISAVSLVESPLYSKHYDRALKIMLEEIKLIGPK